MMAGPATLPLDMWDYILVGMTDALTVLMRWMHITSAVTLIGGVLYARFVLAPVLQSLPQQEQETLGAAAATRYRSLMFLAMALLTGTGIYDTGARIRHSGGG